MTGRPESDTDPSTQDETLEPDSVRYDFCGQVGGWMPEPCHVNLPRLVLEALEID